MRVVKLPSGAELKLTMAPFAVSKALYQAILNEGISVKIHSKENVENVIKDIFCTVLSSKDIEDKIHACLERCLYNGLKITDETFEPESARTDYLNVLFEVASENVMPFMKDLYAKYSPLLEKLKEAQK